MHKSHPRWAGQLGRGWASSLECRVNSSTATPTSQSIKTWPFWYISTAASLGSPPCQAPSPARPCRFQSAPLHCPGGHPLRVGWQQDLGEHLLLVLQAAMEEWPPALELAVGGSFLLLPCLAVALALVVALHALYQGLALPTGDLWEVASEDWE